MTDQPSLSARNLTKVIGSRTIVDDVSFELHPGEVFGFLGPNGAGKTTTIRMLVGLIAPTQGSVSICGFDLRRDFEQAMRCIGCIVENPDLYRFMTGRENLEHFARMLGSSGQWAVGSGQRNGDEARAASSTADPASSSAHCPLPTAHSEIARVADLVGLSHRLEQRVGTYSLGMRQRLGIAQAMLGSPRVLILDEPANGLDPAGIREIRELLRMLASKRNLAVFVSSHLLGEVELTCDRVAIIHRGKILRSGTVKELISSQRAMEIRVADVERAARIVAGLGHESTTIANDTLLVPIDEADAPPIIAAIAGAGIEIFHARPRVHTLEEMFLDVTGGETVD